MENLVVVIAGPTASGKSQLAIDLALKMNGVILNADSMQVYEGLPILSAAPSKQDKKLVEHRLYGIFSNDFKGSVVDWLERVVEEIRDVWKEGKTPIVVGGTGLYIDNLINGTTPVPETSRQTHEKTKALLSEIGVNALYDQLKKIDPDTALKLSQNDTTRIRRAYEVWLDTKIPLSVWHKKPMVKKLPEASFFVIKIMPEQKELDERCYVRFDKMIEQGGLKEAEEIFRKNPDNQSPSMKTLGLPELLNYLKHKISLEQAICDAKLHTRQYAKRQLTWFRKQPKANFELTFCYSTDNEIIKKIIFSVKNQL